MNALRGRFLELVHKADTPAVRWGAISLSYAMFMDGGDPNPWLDHYTRASVHVLNEVDDTISMRCSK
jgi:hypothetical protein